jgi:hypothetical protein
MFQGAAAERLKMWGECRVITVPSLPKPPAVAPAAAEVRVTA